MKFRISLLDTSCHDREYFDCGKPQLNDYLKKTAGQDAKRGYSKTFVATNEADTKKVVGYYCTSASTIKFENIPTELSKKLPKYTAPAMLIGRLAVDQRMQGKRLGETLLMHAFDRAISAALEIAIFAIRVDALDEDAKKFYLRYGFVPFKDKELSLFLPMATIIASCGENINI